MKHLYQAVAVTVFLALLFILFLRTKSIHVYDDFESARLSWIRWSRSRFAPGAVTPEESVVRSGRRALAVTVHSGDRYEAASDDGAATERAELMEPWSLFSRTQRTYVYSFSLYLPHELPQTSERLVIAQWKQVCEARRCRPDNPILAIRCENGQIVVTRHGESGKEILYQGTADVRGQWLDFRFVTRFDSTDHGQIDATLNRQTIVHYRGLTAYQPAPGYPARGLIYFKTGLYRDARGEPPWTIYVDEYRKDECINDACE